MKSKLNLLLTFLALLLSQHFFAQTKSVTGTIVDQYGETLAGVNVLEKGTKNGTQSDFNGKYTIKINDGAILVFSYIGMISQEVIVSASKIDISMKEDARELEAVVVTALGIKRKPDEITTASQVVKTDELNQAKATNAAVGLVGKVSGLQINTINNGVNPNTRIQLRGFRSISGNNEALIVINGVISTSAAFTELNPEIIESINVIKGSNGAALYGSQGSNGVIIVTTKKETKKKINLRLH